MPNENSNSNRLSSQALTQNKPFEIQPTPPATQASGMLAEMEAGADAFTKNLERERTEAKEGRDDSLASYIQGLSTVEGETAATARLYAQEGGVDDIDVERQEINTQIRNEQHSLRRRLEALDKNPEGLFGGQLTNEKRRIENESLKRQADLYIIQQGIQGRYDSAKAVADRAVAALMETQRNRNEALRVNYEANKELFSTADQRAFESMLSDRERALDREERQLKEISDLSLNALQNGAPPSVVTAMRGSSTVEDAIRVGGQYVDAYDRALKQLQLENIRSQINDRQTPTGKPLTATQATALGYGERLVQSDLIIDRLAQQFASPLALGGTTVFGLGLPNQLKSADRQQFEQAQRNFINAVLRRESGAVISPEEFANARQQYFPQPGDAPEVLIQKDQNRALVTKNLLREAEQDTSVQDAVLQDPLKVGVSPTLDNPLGI